jgi:uncharacterized membrane protein YeaQ/YmgE (transglycosylase-associated protein family)
MFDGLPDVPLKSADLLLGARARRVRLLPAAAPHATVAREASRDRSIAGKRQGQEDTMGIISWIVLGAIAGFLANLLVGGSEGLIGTIILGIIGAVVGGYLAQAVLHKGDVTGVNIESIVIAVIGAIIVLFVWRALRGSSRRS